MIITRARPMKAIDVHGRRYLERYFMFQLFGVQVWLHRFLSGDGDRHHHSPPWTAMSIVLSGRYYEQSSIGCIPVGRWRKAWGMPTIITPEHVHRIAAVEPETWTLMIVGRGRKPTWQFFYEGVAETVPTGSRWWYMDAKPRDFEQD